MKAEAETECCDHRPRAASHKQQLEEAKNRLSSESLEGVWLCQHLKLQTCDLQNCE